MFTSSGMISSLQRPQDQRQLSNNHHGQMHNQYQHQPNNYYPPSSVLPIHQRQPISTNTTRFVSSNDSVYSNQTDPSADDFDMDDVSILDSVMLAQNRNNNNDDDPSCNDDSTISSHYSYHSLHSRYGRSTAGPVILEHEPTLFPYPGGTNSDYFQPHSHEQFQQPVSSRVTQRNNFNTSRNRCRRKVGFAEDALLYSCDRTSYEEVIHTWYNRDELAAFKSDRKDVVKLLKKHNFNLNSVMKSPSIGKKYCLRGYEAYFSVDKNKELRKNRERVISSVMSEQNRQKQRLPSTMISQNKLAYLLDHNSIAKHSWDASQWARETANTLGRQDEEEVISMHGFQDSTVVSQYEKKIKEANMAFDYPRGRPNAILWNLVIDKSIDDVIDQHEAEFLNEAMVCSMQEHQQHQQQQQQPIQHTHKPNEFNQSDSVTAELLRMQIEQLRVLRQHQQQQELAQMQGLQQSQMTGYDVSAYQQQQQNYNNQFEDATEHQQLQLLRQMELEQQRQQEQLRLMAEAQMKMEEEIRQRQQSNNNGNTLMNNVDEDLESALKLVEAMQFQHQHGL